MKYSSHMIDIKVADIVIFIQEMKYKEGYAILVQFDIDLVLNYLGNVL